MSTFAAPDPELCANCGARQEHHEFVTDGCPTGRLVCPRAVSQPLSRVVAGPSTDGHTEACWTDGARWTCAPGCQAGSVARLGADVAAFRALTPAQWAALLAIGADGPALLEAAREAARREASLGLYGPRGPLATVVARIDAGK